MYDAVTQPTSIYTQLDSNLQVKMLLEKLLQQQEESIQQTNKLIELLTTIINKLIKWILAKMLT